MKKILFGFGLGTAILFAILYMFMLYLSWDIFGFWTLVSISILSIVSSLYFNHYLGAGFRREEERFVINPKEWPKLLNIIIHAIFIYYLQSVIPESLTLGRSVFAYAYLALEAFQILLSLTVLIRDRNDFVMIANGKMSFRNNSDYQEFETSDMKGAVACMEGVRITFLDGKEHIIPTKQMNFGARDVSDLLKELEHHLKG